MDMRCDGSLSRSPEVNPHFNRRHRSRAVLLPGTDYHAAASRRDDRARVERDAGVNPRAGAPTKENSGPDSLVLVVHDPTGPAPEHNQVSL
jgi:hypothetical protein